jgi:transcriptional regulator with XRE-family HTH domain
MQAFSTDTCNPVYCVVMPAGRPAQSQRTDFGERLFHCREQKGFSQKQMADALNIKQQSYAAWERRSTALKPEQLAALARILDCSIDDLIGQAPKVKRGSGPAGRVRRVFEAVNQLPRHQQNKVAEFVEAFVKQQHAASQ